MTNIEQLPCLVGSVPESVACTRTLSWVWARPGTRSLLPRPSCVLAQGWRVRWWSAPSAPHGLSPSTPCTCTCLTLLVASGRTVSYVYHHFSRLGERVQWALYRTWGNRGLGRLNAIPQVEQLVRGWHHYRLAAWPPSSPLSLICTGRYFYCVTKVVIRTEWVSPQNVLGQCSADTVRWGLIPSVPLRPRGGWNKVPCGPVLQAWPHWEGVRAGGMAPCLGPGTSGWS